MQLSFRILSLSLLICLSFANDKVNECSSCEMPCRVSNPNLPRSVLTKIFSSSVDSYRVTTVLDGYQGYFNITISHNSTDNSMYFAKINVQKWRFDAHCKILCEAPNIILTINDPTLLKVSFPFFRSFQVRLQPTEDYTALFFYERVGIIQNELYERVSELEKKESMRSKLKYAISNATITGHGWSCNIPNPMIYPTGDRTCQVPAGNWVYFDFGEGFILNLIRFRLHDKNRRTYTYSISISPDRINWETLAAGVSGQSAQEYLLDNPTKVRYIKMKGFNNLNQYLHLCSVSVDWL